MCEDTPTYNKTAYNNLVNSIGAAGLLEHLDVLITREDCVRGTEYKSTNIMDYAVSYSNTFTANQRERVRYILEKEHLFPVLRIVKYRIRLVLPVRVNCHTM